MTGENAIDLKGGATASNVNVFASAMMEYLAPMTMLKKSTTLRDFWKAGNVQDKLDKLFKEWRKPQATGTRDMHMVVGVPSSQWKAKTEPYPALVTVSDDGTWNPFPKSGWISREQMERNVAVSQVLFKTITTTDPLLSLIHI